MSDILTPEKLAEIEERAKYERAYDPDVLNLLAHIRALDELLDSIDELVYNPKRNGSGGVSYSRTVEDIQTLMNKRKTNESSSL